MKWCRNAGCLILFAVVAAAVQPVEARAGRVIGGPVTHVRDGDTIVVDGRPIRLVGLHAPELNQRGGWAARQWMIDHIRERRVSCRLNGDRNRDRWMGICTDRRGDLAAQLIAAGRGRDCPRWSGGRYTRFETAAGRRLPLPAYCSTRAKPRRAHGHSTAVGVPFVRDPTTRITSVTLIRQEAPGKR